MYSQIKKRKLFFFFFFWLQLTGNYVGLDFTLYHGNNNGETTSSTLLCSLWSGKVDRITNV